MGAWYMHILNPGAAGRYPFVLHEGRQKVAGRFLKWWESYNLYSHIIIGTPKILKKLLIYKLRPVKKVTSTLSSNPSPNLSSISRLSFIAKNHPNIFPFLLFPLHCWPIYCYIAIFNPHFPAEIHRPPLFGCSPAYPGLTWAIAKLASHQT